VRELVASRKPLYRFALDNVLTRYDLDRADGRVDALRDAAGLVAGIRDKTKVETFSRELAHMVGVDLDQVRAEVRRAADRPAAAAKDERRPVRGDATPAPEPARPALPSLSDPRFLIERELLKLVIQHPAGVGRTTAHVTTGDFTHPTFQGVWEAVTAAGGPVAGVDDAGWAAKVRGSATDPAVVAAVTELGVEPVRGTTDPNPTFAVAYVYRLQELTTSRRIADVKARLQRTNPVDQALDYNRMFGELVMLEQHRRKLREGAVGQPGGQS
jgi:DNA primase